jgi:hypothetical protein
MSKGYQAIITSCYGRNIDLESLPKNTGLLIAWTVWWLAPQTSAELQSCKP